MTRPAHTCAIRRAPRKTCRSLINFGRFIRTSKSAWLRDLYICPLRGGEGSLRDRRIPSLDVKYYSKIILFCVATPRASGRLSIRAFLAWSCQKPQSPCIADDSASKAVAAFVRFLFPRRVPHPVATYQAFESVAENARIPAIRPTTFALSSSVYFA